MVGQAVDFKQNETGADKLADTISNDTMGADRISEEDKEALVRFDALQQQLLAGEPAAEATTNLISEQCPCGAGDLEKARALAGLRSKNPAATSK